MTVTLSDNFATILRNHRPQTGLAAKFSIEFAMACAIVARRVGLAELTDEFVQRAEVQALMPRVKTSINTDYDAGRHRARRWPTRCSSRWAVARCLQGEKVRWARGHAARPLAEAELFAKFEDCLAVGRSAVPAQRLFDRLRGMDHVGARSLTEVH